MSHQKGDTLGLVCITLCLQDIYRLSVVASGDGGCVAEAVLHHDMGTGVVMNSATHPTSVTVCVFSCFSDETHTDAVP